MKILIIHQYFLEKQSAGGSRFNQFVKYWTNAGHEITVITGTVDYATGKKDKKYRKKLITKEKYSENIAVLKCYVSETYNKNFLGRLWAYFSFTFSSTWAGLFYIGKQDIIVATSPPLFAAVPAYILKKLKKIPLIFEIRDLWPKFAIDTGVLKNPLIIKLGYWLENFIYKKADLINALTPAFEQYLVDEKSISKQKIVAVPNAADLDIFQPGEKYNWVRKKYEWKNKFVILYIGAHGVANDLWQILNVAKLLKNNHDILFVLVGDGMEKPKLKKIAQEKQLNNIQFIDSIPKNKVPALVRAADICTAILSPVFTTTYPNKVFDYMACAKPIILPIDGAIREMAIDKGKAGIFITPGDAKAFKDAIIELKNDPEKCKDFGENGYKFVIKNFDREKLAIKYLKIIQRLIDKNFSIKNNPYQTYCRYRYAWDLVPYETENFLDFGCYDGKFASTLKNKVEHLFAIDVNGKAIQNGKQKYPWINFSIIKNGKTKFAKNFFDVITLLDVLEHVPNEKKILNEIHRILKPGGKLILSIPYKGIFAWADAGNIKFKFPHIHKFIYIHVLKQADIYHKKFIDISNGLMGDISVSKNMFHKHYNIRELKNILEPHLKIIYLRRFGLLQPILYIMQYLYKLIYKNRSKLLIKIISFDQKINFGGGSYNIIIVTKKD